MNITFLIGNGFDLKIGMRTKYEDFYNYYIKQENKNEDIIALKEEIEENRENWSDLEQAFGQYTNKLQTEGKVIKLYENLISNLQTYLQLEEESFDISDIHKQKVFDDILSPYKYLRQVENESLGKFININNHLYIRFITFNYTKSLEKLTGYFGKRIIISKTETGYQRSLESIEHIHGYIEERMIIGVNDDSQIANEKFKSSNRIKRRLIKSDCNQTYGLGHDEKCVSWIQNSSLICIYGLSFGDTDKKWWINIGNRLLNSDCRVIIFVYNPKIQKGGAWGPNYEDEVEFIKDLFLNKTTLPEIEKERFKDRIYVGINTDIFNYTVSKFKKSQLKYNITDSSKQVYI